MGAIATLKGSLDDWVRKASQAKESQTKNLINSNPYCLPRNLP